MLIAKKKKLIFKDPNKKGSTIVVIEERIDAKDTLFPEKVAKAKEMLRHTKFPDGFFD